MAKFRIYSPSLGKREDYPSILLNKAITPEIVDTQSWNGELRKAKKRLPELIRTFYEIDSFTSSTVTLTVAGVTAEFASSDSIIMYNVAGEAEGHTVTGSADVSSKTVISVASVITGVASERVFNSLNVPTTDPTSQDFLKVQTPDTNEVIRSERFITANELERLVVFTKANVYRWDTTLTRYISLFASAGETDYWDCDEYGDYLVATNNIDRPQQWDGNSASSFETMDTQYTSATAEPYPTVLNCRILL
jgi:hypothetical protein